MKKVRITKAAMGKEVKNQVPYVDNTAAPNYDNGDIGSDKAIDVNTTLKPVPRKKANLEAEKGETAVTDLNRDGLPEFYKIGGKLHSKGGTPLNLPDNSFIFSNSKDLVCKDPAMLTQFGKTPTKKKKKYTPAELSLQYNINHYRKILADPNSDNLQISTAEAMIKNYMDKLGALALLQESKKGFDSGIPEISKPYLQKIGIKTEDIVPPKQPPQMPQGMQQPPTPAQPPMGQFVTGGEPGVGFWLNTDVKTKDGSPGIFGNNMAGTANLAQNAIFGITDAINRNNEGNAIQDELINKSVSAGFEPIAATDRGKWGVNNRMFDAKRQEYPTQFKAYTAAEHGGQHKYDDGGPVNVDMLGRITIDGSSGSNMANILKDNAPITGGANGITVSGVRAEGDNLIVDAKLPFLGNQSSPLGKFIKTSNGYKWEPNQTVYSQFEKNAPAEDKAIFNNFVSGVETNIDFANDVRGAISGTNKYEASSNATSYFAPSETNNSTSQGTSINNNTVNKSNIPSADLKYIDRIIDYELNHGKGDGKGLPLNVAFKTDVTGINFTGDQVKDRQLVKDYIKTIDNKYKNLPVDLR